MRKRSKYTPRGVRLDTMDFVVTGMSKLSTRESDYITMHLKNMSALDSLSKGLATHREIDIIIGVINVAEALCELDVGAEYHPQVLSASSALYDVCKRSLNRSGRFVCTGEEWSSIKLGFEIHDAQLEITTIGMLGKALDIIEKAIKAKKAKAING